MWIRNYKGELVYFDITKYHNEEDLYIKKTLSKWGWNGNFSMGASFMALSSYYEF